MDNAQRINQDSGDTEYYTPQEIIEAARKTMGCINLDPASSFVANVFVKADHIFTKESDGLNQKWFGNVWLNHPFSKGEKACKPNCKKKACKDRGYHITEDIPGNKDWINKLVESYLDGDIEQACCITFAATSESWFRPLLNRPQCFLQPRTNYYSPDGTKKKGVTKGSVVTYFGDNVYGFWLNFKDLGKIKVPVVYEV